MSENLHNNPLMHPEYTGEHIEVNVDECIESIKNNRNHGIDFELMVKANLSAVNTILARLANILESQKISEGGSLTPQHISNIHSSLLLIVQAIEHNKGVEIMSVRQRMMFILQETYKRFMEVFKETAQHSKYAEHLEIAQQDSQHIHSQIDTAVENIVLRDHPMIVTVLEWKEKLLSTPKDPKNNPLYNMQNIQLMNKMLAGLKKEYQIQCELGDFTSFDNYMVFMKHIRSKIEQWKEKYYKKK